MRLFRLAAVANSKIFVQKNNRPLQVELENGRSRLQNDFQILESMLRGFIASASNVSVYANTICVAKYLLGTSKPLNCIRWMQAVLSKQKGKLFYFLRNSPYSHSARADIIALYLLVSSNKEEKVSCASR
mgnify:CR=1 FL=1